MDQQIADHLQILYARQQEALAAAKAELDDLRRSICQSASEAVMQERLQPLATPTQLSESPYDVTTMAATARSDRCTRAASESDERRVATPPEGRPIRDYIANFLPTIELASRQSTLHNVIARDRTAARLYHAWDECVRIRHLHDYREPPTEDLNQAFAAYSKELSPGNLDRRMRARLTGGMEDFLTDVIGIEVSLGANPFTTPTNCFLPTQELRVDNDSQGMYNPNLPIRCLLSKPYDREGVCEDRRMAARFF